MHRYWSVYWRQALSEARLNAYAYEIRYRVRAYKNPNTGQAGWIAEPIW